DSIFRNSCFVHQPLAGVGAGDMGVVAEVTEPAPPPADLDVREVERVEQWGPTTAGRRLLKPPPQQDGTAIVSVDDGDRVCFEPFPQAARAFPEADRPRLERYGKIWERRLVEGPAPRAVVARRRHLVPPLDEAGAEVGDVPAEPAGVGGEGQVEDAERP